MRYKVIPMVFITLILGSILVVFGWQRFNEYQARPVEIDSQTSMQIQNLRHLAVKEGATHWVLEAQTASLAANRQVVALEKLAIVYYLADHSEIRLKAESGFLDTETQNITATGSVRLVYQNYALQTELLQYDHQQGMLLIPGALQIDQGHSQLKADSMQFDLNTRTAAFRGNIRASFYEQL